MKADDVLIAGGLFMVLIGFIFRGHPECSTARWIGCGLFLIGLGVAKL
jgi:hypothetical protein